MFNMEVGGGIRDNHDVDHVGGDDHDHDEDGDVPLILDQGEIP